MKIKNVSCTQFAGVRDQNVSFTDGINVVYGKNESGKSTLVNLLSRTLFQNAKLDRRIDKEFVELYFPGAKKGSNITGDFADGKISFETERGTFTLSKEWGTDARCTLSTPDGVIRDQRSIDQLLKDELLYGEGVYTDMLFSSQRNTDVSLQTILDASKKTDAKKEITVAVSQAFAEGDGISVDAIEQAIAKKIDDIAGKHWDFDRNLPVRNVRGRWATGLGEILKAYYTLEDSKAVLSEISRLETEADKAASTYIEKDAAARSAEEAYERFNAFFSRLAVQSERQKAIARIEKELQKIAEVLSNWPKLSESIEKAKDLRKEKNDRAILDAWNFVQETRAEITEDDLVTVELPYPERAELADVRKAQREITLLQNKLCGMNLNAAINMMGGHHVEVTSFRTGDSLDVSGDVLSITEAVKIMIPGVAEMVLSPANVDVSRVEAQIAAQKEIVEAVFLRYGVETLEALEAYAQKIDDTKAKVKRVNDRIASVLGELYADQLEKLYQNINPVQRTKKEIEQDILSVCGYADVAMFITKSEVVVEGYAAEYGSINDLKAKAFDLDAELTKTKESLSSTEDIPAEYRNISDPDGYLTQLQNDLKLKQSLREAALTNKTATASKLEGYKENISGDPVADVEKAERIFEEQKALLKHWLHIAEVFKAQKENIHDNPMQDIADRFTHYLDVISSGKVSSEFPEADKLNMNIYSDNKLLDYAKLSEGTKETVSLAFRLSVLDHLFPDGGGVIVFDDPFTDMDAERTEQACALVQECAKRHQVIFLTCRAEYAEMLGGKEIKI